MGDLRLVARDNELCVESSGGNFLFALREAQLIGDLLAELAAIWDELEAAGAEKGRRLFILTEPDQAALAELRRGFAQA